MTEQSAVVILNYNGRSYLEQFLPSVIQYSGNAQIVVADNASTDDSVAFLEQHYKDQVRLIRLTKNYGFCGGYNRALQRVKAKYYVLLNSDVEVTENWLSQLLALFEEYPQLSACQPKMLDWKSPNKLEYAGAAGGFIDYLGYPFCRGRVFSELEEDTGQYNDNRQVFWATGACLCIKAEHYWEAGGLDERFFAHMEEIDLCWRLQRKGHQIGYCGQSTVYHVGGGTLNTGSPFKTFLNFRNGLLLLLKNLPSSTLLPLLFTRMLMDGITGLKFLCQGKPFHFWAIFRAHIAFYRMAGEFWKERNHSDYKLQSIYPKSIVLEHFAKGKKRFAELNWQVPAWWTKSQLFLGKLPSNTKSA